MVLSDPPFAIQGANEAAERGDFTAALVGKSIKRSIVVKGRLVSLIL